MAELSMTYKSINNEKIKIFGSEFVSLNKFTCKIVQDDEEYDLDEFFYNNLCLEKKTRLTNITLKCKSLKSISHIFHKCKNLISLRIINILNTTMFDDMGFMFDGCHSLISISNISQLDTSAVKNMEKMFKGCHSLKSLPDISKWDTSNVLYMNKMFKNCVSLVTLPDISIGILIP